MQTDKSLESWRRATMPRSLRRMTLATLRPLLLVFADLPCALAQPAEPSSLRSFAGLEASGAIIGDIRVNTQDIFDLDDPKEDNFLFCLANGLNIITLPGVISRQLLF